MFQIRNYATKYAQSRVLRKYPVGGVFHGYEVKRLLPVPELKLTAVDLLHNQTGSQHLHIDRDDNNNVFSIGFKTNPPDSTGVPHILEHTTLCGSHKYPVRDPFFKMLNRSLANFMNAMTGHDYTFYPFATTNETDFVNLRDVYLDATLNPLLNQQDFLQEGWRLEHTKVDDPNSDIGFKGVVYNEMKGQVSNANYYFWIKFQESYYPSLNNSGGDPTKMTDLQYEDLISFHRNNYHPSNAKTFTYGNFDLNNTLQRLNKEYQGYGRRASKKGELLPIQMKEDVSVETEGQVDPMLPPDKQIKTSMTWICGKPEDTYQTFLLKILGNLLLDGHSSPFYQKLIESGLAYDFSVNTGVESQTAANFITIGVQGCDEVDSIYEVINKVWEEVLQNPFEECRIQAIIQQLELSKKDQRADFGLQLLYSVLPGWVNKTDPFDSLLFDETLERFQEDWATKGDNLLKDLIKEFVISKPVFKFTMKGSETFSQKLDAEEQERLKRKLKLLDEEDRKVIFERGKQLQELQDLKEDLSCLPSLQISAIPRVSKTYPLTEKDNVLNRITDTNGITYVRGKRLLNHHIPRELYPFLPLYADSLTNLGTSTEEFSTIEEQIKLHTGGVSTRVSVNPDAQTGKPMLLFQVDGWALNSKTDHIFEFWKKLLCETDFRKHKEKLKVLIRSLASSNTASVAETGHAFARNFGAAHLSVTKAINESLNGIEQLQLINKLSQCLDDEALFEKEVVSKLVELQSYINGSSDMKFMITSDSQVQIDAVNQQITGFLSSLPKDSKPCDFYSENYSMLENPGKPTLLQFPFQVHYTAKCYPGVSYTHPDGAKLQILSNMLTHKYLHREIREKGGAYGGGATYSALDGTFSFYSYRDPHALNSLSTFDSVPEFILNKSSWGEPDLNEAKLSVFQQVDSPMSAKNEGTILFHYDVTDEMKQRRREQLLDVNLNDIHQVAEEYLKQDKSIASIVGPEIPNFDALVQTV
ncbi:Cym1 [Kluyveromyces lactis]|nr:Cym1 [Kluyveromyces lactis]